VIRYAKPDTLDEALALLAQAPWRILAGGTDFYPAQGSRPFRDNVLDINGLAELRGMTQTGDHLVIGARTTWTDLLKEQLPPALLALQQAAREVGSVQIQNTGTIAGNLCNASPAADGVPPLLAVDAEVVLSSAAGRRVLGLADFVVANRRTQLQPGELLTAVRVPRESTGGNSAFIKLGARRYLVISIAMAAVRVEVGGDGRVTRAAVSVGACSAAAKRLSGVEGRLLGQTQAGFADAVADDPFDELAPIDDVRGSAGYRREAARELVLRALTGAMTAAGPASRAAA
jgi:CO/xanthine dehydrogenase FAD-binding subunit